MADVVWTGGLTTANNELDKLVEFNKDKPRGQYKYAYVVKLAKRYVVRLSKKKPTSKTARSITKIR